MSFDDATDLELLLFRQDNVLSRSQAQRFFSDAAIEHRLAANHWRRLHRGIFLTVTGPTRYEHRLWCAALACGPNAFLAGATAAAADGLRQPGGVIHVLIPLARRVIRSPSGVALHRSSVLPHCDLHRMAHPPRTRTARSIVDAAQWSATLEPARGLIAEAFRRQLVGLDDVLGVLDRLPRAKHRAWTRAMAIDAADGSHSAAEHHYLTLSRNAGLPEPSRQVVRVDARGTRRYLDLRYDDWRLHIEIDGGHHLEPGSWWADMKRQNDLSVSGDRVLRFPAWAVRERPNEVIAQVRDALRAAGWTG